VTKKHSGFVVAGGVVVECAPDCLTGLSVSNSRMAQTTVEPRVADFGCDGITTSEWTKKNSSCLVEGGVVIECAVPDAVESVPAQIRVVSEAKQLSSPVSDRGCDGITTTTSMWTRSNSGCLIEGGIIIECTPTQMDVM